MIVLGFYNQKELAMCDDKHLKRATEMASLSTFRQRIGCVITNKKGRVIAAGFNKKKTHPKQKAYAIKTDNEHHEYLHAEIDALVKSHHSPHTIYISRIMRNGNTGLARPCDICMMAIKEAGIQRIVYTK